MAFYKYKAIVKELNICQRSRGGNFIIFKWNEFFNY
jgi:hypothetical protein